MKNVLITISLWLLIAHSKAVEPRRFATVDGIFTKGEFIDTNPETNERLYIRYSPISNSGVELELTSGSELLWREHLPPLANLAHSKYTHEVSVRIENGKLFVTSTGWKTVFEVRELKTGKLLTRKIDKR